MTMTLNLSRSQPVILDHVVRRVKLRDVALASWRNSRSGLFAVDVGNVTNIVGKVIGKVDMDALSIGLSRLVRRHRMLLARVQEDSTDVFIVLDEAPAVPDIEIVCLQTNDEVTTEGAVEGRVREAARQLICRPFEFDPETHKSGVLFRAFLVSASSGQDLAGFVIHHSIADGVSIRVLAADWSRYYNEAKRGKTSSNAVRDVDYVDDAMSLEQWLSTNSGREALTYWRDLCRDVPRFTLPPDPMAAGSSRGRVKFTLPCSNVQSLRAFSTAQGVRIFSLLLAGYFLSIMKVAMAEEGLVIIFHSGRDQLPLLRAMGCFATVTPVRITTRIDIRFDQFLRNVERNCEEVFGATPTRNCFGTLDSCPSFNFMDGQIDPSNYGLFSEMLDLWPDSQVPNIYGNDLLLRGRRGGMSGSLGYRTDLYRADAIKKSILDMFSILFSAVEGSSRTLGEILHFCDTREIQSVVEFISSDYVA